MGMFRLLSRHSTGDSRALWCPLGKSALRDCRSHRSRLDHTRRSDHRNVVGAFIVIGTLAAFKAWRLDAVVGAVAYWPDRIAAGVGAPAPTSHVRRLPSIQNRPPGQGAVCGSQAAQPLSTVQMGVAPWQPVFVPTSQTLQRPPTQYSLMPKSTLSVLGTSTVTVWPQMGATPAPSHPALSTGSHSRQRPPALIWALWVAFTSSTLTCFRVADGLAIWAGGWVIDITANTLPIPQIASPAHSPSALHPRHDVLPLLFSWQKGLQHRTPGRLLDCTRRIDRRSRQAH